MPAVFVMLLITFIFFVALIVAVIKVLIFCKGRL
jgi:hypothetical protein